MSERQMSFDSKCHDLAESFLQDEDNAASETEVCDLAQTIQQAIEDWISFRRVPCPSCKGSGHIFKKYATKSKAREAAS